jgi:hypothetical protein
LNLIRVMPAKGQDASMQKSATIARLIGPVLCAIGIGMLANQATYREMAGTPDWRSAVTAVGWILTCVGAFRIIAPQFATFIASAIITHAGFFTGFGIVLLAAGSFITLRGYAT